jgi:hypothetical protein
MKRTVKTKESRQIEESLLIEGEESIDDVIEEILASDLPEEEEEEEESEMGSEQEGESEEEEQEGESEEEEQEGEYGSEEGEMDSEEQEGESEEGDLEMDLDSEEEESEEEEEDEEEKMESFVSEDLARLCETEANLSEEFKSKAALIFESEVALRVSEIRESLESKYEQKLEENVEKIGEHLTLQIDEYLTYAVDQWIESNQVAIESSLRTDIAEGFMNSLKTLFTENYVEVPESKVDLYNELEQKAGSLEQSLKTTKKLAESLQEKVKTLSREKIIAEESKGLAETQSAKLLKLSESVEFQNEKDFAKKLKTLKEFYFKSEDKTLMDPINEESDIDVTFETIVEGLEEQKGEPAVPKEMKRYLETLTRLHKSSI